MGLRKRLRGLRKKKPADPVLQGLSLRIEVVAVTDEPAAGRRYIAQAGFAHAFGDTPSDALVILAELLAGDVGTALLQGAVSAAQAEPAPPTAPPDSAEASPVNGSPVA